MGCINDFGEELPLTKDELFQFMSKQLLLNSGPFILKMLQMVRPALTPELATKYNLTKLAYPKLTPVQVNSILSQILPTPRMINVYAHKSASVGHVCLAYSGRNPQDEFVIKIIKPISIAQSCWEYSILRHVFDEGSCESNFVVNMLKSNGREMNVTNEIANIHEGHALYTGTYRDLFSVEHDAVLTTVDVREGVLKQDTWFAFAMTMAPGLPLSDLIEKNLLNNDTSYRSALHRGLDILVYQFIFNLIKHGFYHGDLHSGNIFYSFEKQQMTLIDFGAVGRLDLFSGDKDILEVLDILVMSAYYNYPGLLDKLTKLLNSKCGTDMIDTTNAKYTEFKHKLHEYSMKNMVHNRASTEKTAKYEDLLFGDDRLDVEKSEVNARLTGQTTHPNDSIYAALDIKRKEKETVVENKDILPDLQGIDDNIHMVSFNSVMVEIAEFYAQSGVNITVKFNQLFELQKAYALLMGVLHKAKYEPTRLEIILSKAILNTGHITKLINFGTSMELISVLLHERSIFKKQVDKLTKRLQSRDTLTRVEPMNISQLPPIIQNI
jgi:hypothetical protein